MAIHTYTLNGNETYLGTPFPPDDDFTITDSGGAGGNTVTLGNGIDNLTLQDGNNTVTLGNGADRITAGAGNNTLTTGNGNSNITVGNGNDTITVGTGSNTIVLGNGLDTVSTGAGNNTVSVSGATVSGDTLKGALTSGDGTTNRLLLTAPGTMSPVNVSGFKTYQLANGGPNSLTLSEANFTRLPGGSITVIGGDSGNTIDGSALSAAHTVTLDAGAGTDVLSGGAGSDTYQGTKGALNLDTITNMNIGDKINFTDASLASFSFSRNGSTLTYGGTNQITLSNNPVGTLVISADAVAGIDLTLVASAPFEPHKSPVVLNNFSWAQGWGSPDNPRIVTDVNRDGISDYVGFGYATTFIAYGGTFSGGGSTGPGFTMATAAVQDFGTSEGYTAGMQRGAAAAGVGNGDILYGQGFAGVYWYSATGATATTDDAGNTYNVLQYQSSPNFYGNFGSQHGWTPANGFQILKTSSADASASILGFGNDGIVVGPQAFATGATAASSYVIPLAVGNNSGWDQKVDIRTFTDINSKPIDLDHDGITDFVGMGPNGLVYAYGNTSGSGGAYGLGGLQTAHIDGSGTNFGEVQGWTDAATPRFIVADPKTGHDDIVAFGAAGVYVAMGQNPATHGGEPFGQLYLAMADFGSNQGWSVGSTPRLVGDVTGDGIPDIVGFGTNSTFVAVGSRDGSNNLRFAVDPNKTITDFGSAEGWSGSTQQTVRALGSVAGTGSTGAHSDLILSGATDTQVWRVT